MSTHEERMAGWRATMGKVEASSRALHEVQAKHARENEQEDTGLAAKEREAGLALLELNRGEAQRLADLHAELERGEAEDKEKEALWAQEDREGQEAK